MEYRRMVPYSAVTGASRGHCTLKDVEERGSIDMLCGAGGKAVRKEQL